MDLTTGQIHYFSESETPYLEVKDAQGAIERVPFVRLAAGRDSGENQWVAKPELPATGNWAFRIDLGDKTYDAPQGGEFYLTGLRKLWLQDGEIFSYKPAGHVSPSRVIKSPDFTGSLPTRDLYIYLPRGYKEHTDKHYPVLYMHDGQNCFEAFVHDSFAGSWRADDTADILIKQGRMRECIIVGISNGAQHRVAEYLPIYTIYQVNRRDLSENAIKRNKLIAPKFIIGAAHHTLAYYRDEVAPHIAKKYRVLDNREHRATCGASMGGLFSAYIAWEHTDFARHHALMSPSFWITRTAQGKLETVERLRTGVPRDVRLWLDSGTRDAPNRGDDSMPETLMARGALLENGYREGQDFQYHLDEGGIHHESAWAKRLPLIFQFLFPFNN